MYTTWSWPAYFPAQKSVSVVFVFADHYLVLSQCCRRCSAEKQSQISLMKSHFSPVGNSNHSLQVSHINLMSDSVLRKTWSCSPFRPQKHLKSRWPIRLIPCIFQVRKEAIAKWHIISYPSKTNVSSSSSSPSWYHIISYHIMAYHITHIVSYHIISNQSIAYHSICHISHIIYQ